MCVRFCLARQCCCCCCSFYIFSSSFLHANATQFNDGEYFSYFSGLNTMNIECDNYVYWIRLIHISLVHARTQHLTPIKTDKTNRFQFGFGCKATFSVKPNELYALCVKTGKYFERLVLLNTVFHFISLVLPLPSNRYTAESSTVMCSHEQNFNE